MEIQNVISMGLTLALMGVVAVIMWQRWQMTLMLSDQLRVKAAHRADMVHCFKRAVIDPMFVFLQENTEVGLVEYGDGVWALARKFDQAVLVKMYFSWLEVPGHEDELVCNLETGRRHNNVSVYRFDELRIVLQTCVYMVQIASLVGGVQPADRSGARDEFVRPMTDYKNLELALKNSRK